MNYIEYYGKDSNFWIYFLFLIFILIIGINSLIANKVILIIWIIMISLILFTMYISLRKSKGIINILFFVIILFSLLFASEFSDIIEDNKISLSSILLVFILSVIMIGVMILKSCSISVIFLQFFVIFLSLLLLFISV